MGLFDAIKGQFIEVIEWTETSDDLMVYRFPVRNAEIKMGAQLTVRESQVAIFVNEGQLADMFKPGRYTLQTENMPILTKLKSWKYGFNSPFKAEVYFINTHQFMDQKWGTQNPVMMRDPEFGMLRLRMFGIYSFRVTQPDVFLREVFGTQERFTTDGVNGQIKRMVVSCMSDLLGESKIPALDLASQYDELSQAAKKKLEPAMNELGLSMPSFYIENISLPAEVEAVLDKRTSMGVIGDMGKYTQYQAAEAIRDAANNPSGGAGVGMGIGAGVSLGQSVAQSLQQSASTPASSTPAAATVTCPACGKPTAPGKFCSSCGKPLAALCRKCGAALTEGAKFCPECGAAQTASCPKCGAKLSSGAKFCPECGEKVQ